MRLLLLTAFFACFFASCITTKKYEDLEKAMDRDNYMSPQDAKDFGLIDHVVKSRKVA